MPYEIGKTTGVEFGSLVRPLVMDNWLNDCLKMSLSDAIIPDCDRISLKADE